MKKLLGFCSVGVIAACGSTSDNDGLSDQTITIDELPAAYAKATCEAARSCWGDVFDIIVNGENCEATGETAVNDILPRIKAGIDSGKVRYDGTKLRACIDAVKARGCVDGPEPAECTAAINGTVEVGGSCTMNTECKGPETYCKSTTACPGTCAARELAGAVCEHNNQCAVGLVCPDRQGTTERRCTKPSGVGADCEGAANAPGCGAGLICIGAIENGASGKCRTIADGFSVSAGGTCLQGAPFCKPDLRCTIESYDPVTQTATTRCSPPVASGAACKQGFPDVCPFDQYCDVPANTLDGTCTAKPGAGLPCVTRGNDTICAPGMRCDGGTCRSRQTLGGSCQDGAVCYSETCEGGSCVPAGGCG